LGDLVYKFLFAYCPPFDRQTVRIDPGGAVLFNLSASLSTVRQATHKTLTHSDSFVGL
jgi:hypothetical protein